MIAAFSRRFRSHSASKRGANWKKWLSPVGSVTKHYWRYHPLNGHHLFMRSRSAWRGSAAGCGGPARPSPAAAAAAAPRATAPRARCCSAVHLHYDNDLSRRAPTESCDIRSPLMPAHNGQQNPPLLPIHLVIHTGSILATPTPLPLSPSQFNFNYIKSPLSMATDSITFQQAGCGILLNC